MSHEAYVRKLLFNPVFFVQELFTEIGWGDRAPRTEIEAEAIRFFFTGTFLTETELEAAGFDLKPLYTKRIALLPRGEGKTDKLSSCAPLWWNLRDHETRVKLLSKSHGHASEIVSQMRSWVEQVWFLDHLKPDESKQHRDRTDAFDTGTTERTKSPSVQGMGIEGQIVGTRSSHLVADDVETDANTITLDARQRLATKTKEFTTISSYGNQEVAVVGTYWHEESVYLSLQERGYTIYTVPACIPTPDEAKGIHGLSPLLQSQIDDGLVKPGDIVFPNHPKLHSRAELMAEGHTYFMMQYMLLADTGERQRYPLKLSDLIVPDFEIHRDRAPLYVKWGRSGPNGKTTEREDIECLGFAGDGLLKQISYADETAEYTGTKMWVDPAGSGSDEFTWAIVSHLGGYLWVKSVDGVEGGLTTQVYHRVAEEARKHGVTEIIVEGNGGWEAVALNLQAILPQYFREPSDNDPLSPNGWRASVDLRKSTGQKELRLIRALEPVMNQHRLIVSPEALHSTSDRKHSLQYQLTRLTSQRNSLPNDDRVDALGSCVGEWTQALGLSPEKAQELARQREWERLIEEDLREAGEDVEHRWTREVV